MRNADALRLLADARSGDALLPLVRALGFHGAAEPLARDVAATLAGVRHARVVAGADARRALVAEVGRGAPLDEIAPEVATQVARVAPGARWLVALAADDGVALAVPRVERAGVRVATLVCDPRRVLASDAEQLCALAAASVDRWGELLGREALTRRFYRRLERSVHALARSARGAGDPGARAELALLHVSRLLFLAFLETKGWLDGDHAFLRRHLDACVRTGGDYHRRVLRPLFFGTLNTPASRRAAAARAFGRVPFLNGGLFAPTPLERRHAALRLDDAALGDVVVELLGRHRFTARERHGVVSESAVDPEMLGRAFESLMAASDRRATGAFYTPHTLVERTTGEALRVALEPSASPDAVAALLDGRDVSGADAAALRRRLGELRVLDPACGSGAFLVHALERVASLLAHCGDPRPTAAVRREVLARSVFGVDVNATAVWLCELRLWLAVVVESDEADPMAVPPLPNLDRNVRVGDALAAAPSAGWGGEPWGEVGRAGIAVERLRARYVRASGRRKATLGAALEQAERAAALATLERMLDARRAERAALLAAARGRDLFGARRGSTPAERRRLAELRDATRALAARRLAVRRGAALPFGFAWHFPDLAARAGADVVLGNPPWVRPHALGTGERRALRAAYESCREAAWRPGAAAAGAGRGFGGQADLAAPFVERALALARPGGVVSLLVPSKLWRALAGGGVRRVLAREAVVRAVEDWSDAPALFDAAVYPSLVVAERAGSGERGAWNTRASPSPLHAPRSTLAVRVHGADHARCWTTQDGALPFDPTPGAPWVLVPPDARAALDALRAAGVPLGEAGLGRVRLGVKCGCNGAFVVRVTECAGALAHVDGVWPDGTPRHGAIERALLRPALRGDDGDEHLVWPYDAGGRPLATLPPNAARWFAPWRARLAARTDARPGARPGARAISARWWALFRTGAAACDAPRVAWADVARALRPRVLPARDPTVPLNSCYVVRCASDADAAAIAALLGSAVANGWCAALAEPARGGYRRHLAWTVALLPVPRDWAAAREILLAAAPPSIDALAAAYGVSRELIAALTVLGGRP